MMKNVNFVRARDLLKWEIELMKLWTSYITVEVIKSRLYALSEKSKMYGWRFWIKIEGASSEGLTSRCLRFKINRLMIGRQYTLSISQTR